MIEEMLAYNREFVRAKGYEKFQTSKYPDKKIAILTCMDTRLVELLPPEGEELEIITRQIANAHTLFNALCTLIWLPLTPLMVRLVTTLVPEKRTE